MEYDAQNIRAAILRVLASHPEGIKPSSIIARLGQSGGAYVRPELEKLIEDGLIKEAQHDYCLTAYFDEMVSSKLAMLQSASAKFREAPNGAENFDTSWEYLEGKLKK